MSTRRRRYAGRPPSFEVLEFTAPTDLGSADGPVSLGIRFSVLVAWRMYGVEVLMSATTPSSVGAGFAYNRDTHAQLAAKTFTAGAPGSWVRVPFAAPVLLSPGVNYIAGYLTDFHPATVGYAWPATSANLYTDAVLPTCFSAGGAVQEPTTDATANYYVTPYGRPA